MQETSILNGTKKALGIDGAYAVFDPDIIMHINSVFSTLNQLGIGPVDGFEIEDSSTTWDVFLLGNPRFNFVKTYMYLRVRLLFDPPATSFLIAAYEKQKEEFEWRINTLREGGAWLPVNTTEGVLAELDGGNAVGG